LNAARTYTGTDITSSPRNSSIRSFERKENGAGGSDQDDEERPEPIGIERDHVRAGRGLRPGDPEREEGAQRHDDAGERDPAGPAAVGGIAMSPTVQEEHQQRRERDDDLRQECDGHPDRHFQVEAVH
jgi:hypothetical protein